MKEIDSNEWEFKLKEGNQNLLLNFKTTNNEKTTNDYFKGKLLRLKKKKNNNLISLELNLFYYENIIKPLLKEDSTLLLKLEKLNLTSNLLNQFNELIKSSRPVTNKRYLEELDLNSNSTIILNDLTFGLKTLSIEIKPKWGFLPSLPSSTSIKSKYCRFCTHRFYKLTSSSSSVPISAALKEHEIGYCPLDLYSNDEARVRKASAALWDGWIRTKGEGNTFRIFCRGEKVGTDEIGLINLHEFLLENLPSTSTTTTKELIINHLLPTLLSSTVLSKLKSLQADLDPLDIEVLYPLVLSLISSSSTSTNSESELLNQPTESEWQQWYERWSATTGKEGIGEEERSTRDLILAYLVSATFKDCSLFFRSDFSSSTSSSTSSSNSCATLNNDAPEKEKMEVKIIDLDMKPIEKFIGYFELDEKIWNCLQGVLDSRSKSEEEVGGVRECYV